MTHSGDVLLADKVVTMSSLERGAWAMPVRQMSPPGGEHPMKILVIVAGGLCLLSVGLALLVGPLVAVDSYIRTRHRWPYAWFTWLVYVCAHESLCLGIACISIPVFLAAVRSPTGIPLGIPLVGRRTQFDELIVPGIGLCVLGVIITLIWIRAVYAPAKREFGAVYLQNP